MIRRINANFVPVALKAGLVNNPPGGEEGRLDAEIGRSKPAPQGICVVNSAGKVLNWVLMFDDEQSVLAFLDHALQRFAKYPAAKQSVAAERFMKFPSAKLEDVADSGRILPVVERHATGTNCPASPPLRPGTVVARVFGRALDSAGRPVADTLRASQLARLRQLELQQEGLFALGRPNIAMELKITDDQRQQFMVLLQTMQREIELLIKDAQAKGHADDFRPQVMKIRTQYAAPIEALLTAIQKQKWKELLGDPFDPAE